MGASISVAHAQKDTDTVEVVASVQKGGILIKVTKARLLRYAKTRPQIPLKSLIREIVEFELNNY